MEYTVYPLYKKTCLIYSPPQHLGSPAHVAYYQQPKTLLLKFFVILQIYSLIINVYNIFDTVNVCLSVTKCNKAEISSTNLL
jgi:hypothetical protein